MKRIIALALVFLLSFSCVGVFAEETEGYKAALATVKERLGNTDEYDEFSGHVSTDESGTSYSFSWNSDGKSLNATITEGGVVVYYDAYTKEYNDSVAISERLTRSEAEKRAKELFSVINPTISDCVEFVDCRSDSNGFRFDIIRTENGYRVVGNDGTLWIDARGDRIQSLYLSYDESAVFQTGDIISPDSAKSAFKEKLGFELRYAAEWNKDDERTVRPVYSLKSNYNKFISALTGEVLEVTYDDGNFKFANTYASADMAVEESASGGFSVAEISELSDIELTISEKNALDSIKNCKYFNLPDAAFENYSISTYDIDDETRGYRFSFRWDDCFANARVNANSGEILSFGKGVSGSDAKYTAEQAEKTANEAFAALAGGLSAEYRKNENEAYEAVPYKNDEAPKTASFSYARYVNGIPFYDNYVNITVDLSDNSVCSYNIYHSYIDFPAIDGVVSIDAAAEEYFTKAGFEPVYIYDNDEYKLVYSVLDEYGMVDAFTGKLDGTGTVTGYNDVSGHYCENVVNSLLESEIGFNTEELKPDEPIKQKEFAALLRECVSYDGAVMLDDDYDYDWLYEYRVDNIIDDESERNPDGNVTRLDAAKYTVCAMGYGEIGKLDVYRPMFTDMEDAGYASILCGLKIMNGDGCGSFNPAGVLTRAQALIIIYNYLDR